MTGLYSALVAMAFTSVAWLAKMGVVVGALLGLALAYAPIARVVRAQGEAPQPLGVRRFASVCCLLWGLVLPTAFATGGLLWGLARGLGNVVEGPVSTTVRSTATTWIARANGLRTGVLGRYPLAKRLTEVELMVIVRAAPEWTSEILGHDEVAAASQKIHGVTVPPQVLTFVRQEFHALTRERAGWLGPVVERLRGRAQGAAGERPTVQETIEALVAPEVFTNAAATIRATAGHYIRIIVLVALVLAALLAGALRFFWKLASAVKSDAPGAEPAHG